MRLAGHVARGKGEVYTGFWWGNGKRPLVKPGVDGNILKWISKKSTGGGGGWTRLIWLRTGTGGGFL
jgi:hypothetical protein